MNNKVVCDIALAMKKYVLDHTSGNYDEDNLFRKICNAANCMIINAMMSTIDGETKDETNKLLAIANNFAEMHIGLFNTVKKLINIEPYAATNSIFDSNDDNDSDSDYAFNFVGMSTITDNESTIDFYNSVDIDSKENIRKDYIRIDFGTEPDDPSYYLETNLGIEYVQSTILAIKAFELAILESAKSGKEFHLENITAQRVCDNLDKYIPCMEGGSKSKWLENPSKCVKQSKFYNDLKNYIDLSEIDKLVDSFDTWTGYNDIEESTNKISMEILQNIADLCAPYEDDGETFFPDEIVSGIKNIIRSGYDMNVSSITVAESEEKMINNIPIPVVFVIKNGKVVDLEDNYINSISNPEVKVSLNRIKNSYNSISNWLGNKLEKKGIDRKKIDIANIISKRCFDKSKEDSFTEIGQTNISNKGNNPIIVDNPSLDNENSSSEKDEKSTKEKSDNSNVSKQDNSNSSSNEEKEEFNQITYAEEVANEFVDKHISKLLIQSCLNDSDIKEILDIIRDLSNDKYAEEYFAKDEFSNVDIGAVCKADSFIVNIIIKGKLAEAFSFCRDNNEDGNMIFIRLTNTILTSHPLFIKNYQNTCKYNAKGDISLNIMSKGGIFNADLTRLYNHLIEKCDGDKKLIDELFSNRGMTYDITLYILSILSLSFSTFMIRKRNGYYDASRPEYSMKDCSFHTLLDSFDKVYENLKLFNDSMDERSSFINDLYDISNIYTNSFEDIYDSKSGNFVMDTSASVNLPDNKILIKDSESNKIVDIKYVFDFIHHKNSNLCYKNKEFSIYYFDKANPNNTKNLIGYKGHNFRTSKEIMFDVYKICKYLKFRDDEDRQKILKKALKSKEKKKITEKKVVEE